MTNSDGSIPSLQALPILSTGQFVPLAIRRGTGRMLVEATIVDSPSPIPPVPTVWTHGTKAVVTAGTPLAISTTVTAYNTVIIVPLRTNTGITYVGSNSATLSQHITSPLILTAPAGECIDLSALYVDVSVSGEGIAWEALT